MYILPSATIPNQKKKKKNKTHERRGEAEVGCVTAHDNENEFFVLQFLNTWQSTSVKHYGNDGDDINKNNTQMRGRGSHTNTKKVSNVIFVW